MARDYTWSRRSIPPRMNTIGELAGLLGLGRHQTRRRLVASGLPYRIYVKRWTNPATGQQYSRRAIAIPQSTAGELIKNNIMDSLGKSWKNIARVTKMKDPEPPPTLNKLIRSIGDIDTDRPGCSLYRPRPLRLKMATIPRFFKVVLGLRRKG